MNAVLIKSELQLKVFHSIANDEIVNYVAYLCYGQVD